MISAETGIKETKKHEEYVENISVVQKRENNIKLNWYTVFMCHPAHMGLKEETSNIIFVYSQPVGVYFLHFSFSLL